MAYIDRRSSPNRTPILVAIGVIHAGAIYALVTGLAGIVPKLVPDTRTEGASFPLPQPTPERPQPKPDPQAHPLPHPGAGSTATAGSTTTTVDLGNRTEVEIGLGGGGEGTAFPLPDPIPSTVPDPVFPPKLAHPIGKPGLWVTPNDYPAADLRAEHEGTTRFRLSIGADGKVQACEVTVSSGFASLDAAACANLRKRAKFVAATDASGAAVPGTYASAVRWTIPKD